MTQELAKRRLRSWIDSFVEYTDGLPTPEIYRRWGAITALSGLLERRVWVVTAGREAYPNLYVLLVGPPGVGKSEVLREVQRVWKAAVDLPGGRRLHVAPDNMTKAALIKVLSKAATRMVLSDVELIEYHSLNVVSSEFSVFFPAYDKEFMSVLTQLYDCLDEYHEERIHSGETRIPNPQLHLIGGTTPGFLSSTFPDQAWTMGFSSRLILIYAGEPVRVSLFSNGGGRPQGLWNDLAHDAKLIAQLYGRLIWSPDAAEFLEDWNAKGCQPAPTHPRLTTYNTRRILQVLKLTIIACISRTSKMVILPDDVSTAISWLVEAEQHMPHIFRDMQGASSGGSNILLDLHHWAMSLPQPIPEGRIINFISQRVQFPNQVLPLLQIALKQGMFEAKDNKWTALGGQ